ncbi:LAME_0H18822g1_1 [Lachancea meyersii CBS 8951]|uniref:Mannosyltransferase n=1 Tax=Lachancea meyersii CBS 8951 TaxID=1266667 RepID=A0A1G4KJ21_9SACH|nr:LAME_0H18822g1_1 [Lachancea meyersii CBS 8951]
MDPRTVHIVGYLVGLFFALEPSYIHPDEHFQSLEILAHLFYGSAATVPWEFAARNAARSFGPLYVAYGPLFYLYRRLGSPAPGLALLYLVRLQNYIVYTCVYMLALQFLLRSKLDRAKATFYISTSYVTWTYQTHSFSNSLETCALLIVLSLFQVLILDARAPRHNHYRTSAILGFVIAFGFFNRITFLGFIALPAIPTLRKFYLGHLKSLLICATTFCLSCCAFIYADTVLYETPHWCIAPLNNLEYNLQSSNLALHGVHPRYTHILINIPQMLGPLVTYFISRKQKINLTMLSCISGLLFLSAFQHQELRFLIPLMPLLCASINLSNLSSSVRNRYITRTWLVFNVVFGVIMGSLHQRGVLTAIEESTKNNAPIDVHVWWKTYSPPTWLYSNHNLVVSTTNIHDGEENLDDVNFQIIRNHVVDLKGCDYELFEVAMHNFLELNASVRVFIPKSTDTLFTNFRSRNPTVRIDKVWETRLNLDLDHLDFTDLSTLIPGFLIYEVAAT